MAVQIILKNSSIEDKRPQASQLTNGEISLNYNEAGAFLCCTDTNGDVQQVGGVKIDNVAPDAPVKQTLWFKPSTLTLSVFDGDKWLPIAGGGGGGGGGGGDIVQIIGNDGIDADTVAGIVTLDIELAGGDDGLEFKTSKLSATLASATNLGSVKVGDNIDVTTGTISVPAATETSLGVVKPGEGVDIASDGTISVDVPTTTTYRGTCELSNPPTGQLNPIFPERGDAYINSASTSAIDAGWVPLTGPANAGDLVIFDGTDWELIPTGGGGAPVTSVNTQIGDVVLTAADVGAATAAQGALADSALQPGDDVSQLNNDAGYITVAESSVTSVNTKTGDVVLDATDVGALAPGDNVSELTNDAEYVSKGDNVSDLNNDAEYVSKGDPVSDLDNDAGYITLAEVPPIPDQAPPVIISDTAPLDADSEAGDLWFNTNDGRTYVYYEDADSSQWVDASPDSGGAGSGDSLWLENAGYLSPKDGTQGVDIGGSKITLAADGSINATGDVNTRALTAYYPGVGGSVIQEWKSDYPSANFAKARLYANGTFALGGAGAGLDTPVFAVGGLDGNTSIGGDIAGGSPNINLDPLGNITAVGNIQSTSQNSGPLAGFRNQIINGDFRTWQRGEATEGINNNSYLGADRFYINRASITGQSLTKSTTAPNGFDYSCTMPTATQGVQYGVEIEEGLAGCFSIGSTWTWSVWSDQDITGETNFARFRQAVGLTAESVDLATLPAFASTGETSNGFTQYSTTFVVTGAPVASSLCVNLYIGGGANRSYAGWQLEPGPVATPFENRPIQIELELCQRYYYPVDTGTLYTYQSGQGSYDRANFIADFPVTMRATPTLELAGGGAWLPMSSSVAPAGDRSGGFTSIAGASGSTGNGIARMQVPRLLSSGSEIERGVNYRLNGVICVTANAEL